MSVVRKASSRATIKKKQEVKKEVQSLRQANLLAELGDTNFGTLNASKDGLIVSYDSDTDEFVLISADQLLSVSAEDNDLPDDFIDVLETELDLGAVQLDSVDGGSF